MYRCVYLCIVNANTKKMTVRQDFTIYFDEIEKIAGIVRYYKTPLEANQNRTGILDQDIQLLTEMQAILQAAYVDEKDAVFPFYYMRLLLNATIFFAPGPLEIEKVARKRPTVSTKEMYHEISTLTHYDRTALTGESMRDHNARIAYGY